MLSTINPSSNSLLPIGNTRTEWVNYTEYYVWCALPPQELMCHLGIIIPQQLPSVLENSGLLMKRNGGNKEISSRQVMLKQKTESLYYYRELLYAISDYILKVVFHDKNECALQETVPQHLSKMKTQLYFFKLKCSFVTVLTLFQGRSQN